MFKSKSFLFCAGLSVMALMGRLDAQKTEISPYSSFGYGQGKASGGTAMFGMGGVYSAYSSVYGSQANFENPAANVNLRFAAFTFEGSSDASLFRSSDNSSRRSASYISRVSLAFPMGDKWRGGFGFQPFSALGYNVLSVRRGEGVESYNKYTGEGAVNSLQFFTSYNLTSSFALGLKASYLFGSLQKEEAIGQSDISLLTGFRRTTTIKGFNFSGGLFYTKDFSGRRRFSFGLNYGLENKVKSQQDYMITTYGILPDLRKYNEDVVYQDKQSLSLNIPQKIGVGLSFGEDFRWNIAAQFDWEQVSRYKLANEQSFLNDRFRTAVGGYIIPNINSYKNYFSRVTYRAGFFYERTPIVVRNSNILKYGMTFGFGLPVGKASDPSEINLGVEFGQQGTVSNNLIRESFANFKLSFTLNDSWFQQRKYN